MNTELGSSTQIMLIIVIAIVGLLVLVGMARFFLGFSRELEYLNSEIRRTTGRERRYWEKKRRRLWLSLIPFIKY